MVGKNPPSGGLTRWQGTELGMEREDKGPQDLLEQFGLDPLLIRDQWGRNPSGRMK